MREVFSNYLEYQAAGEAKSNDFLLQEIIDKSVTLLQLLADSDLLIDCLRKIARESKTRPKRYFVRDLEGYIESEMRDPGQRTIEINQKFFCDIEKLLSLHDEESGKQARKEKLKEIPINLKTIRRILNSFEEHLAKLDEHELNEVNRQDAIAKTGLSLDEFKILVAEAQRQISEIALLRQKMTNENLELVKAVAERGRNKNNYSEALSNGCLALMHAIDIAGRGDLAGDFYGFARRIISPKVRNLLIESWRQDNAYVGVSEFHPVKLVNKGRVLYIRDLDDLPDQKNPYPEETLLAQIDGRYLLEGALACGFISQREAAICSMRYIEGKNHVEIAEALEIEESTSTSTLFNAIQGLRAYIATPRKNQSKEAQLDLSKVPFAEGAFEKLMQVLCLESYLPAVNAKTLSQNQAYLAIDSSLWPYAHGVDKSKLKALFLDRKINERALAYLDHYQNEMQTINESLRSRCNFGLKTGTIKPGDLLKVFSGSLYKKREFLSEDSEPIMYYIRKIANLLEDQEAIDIIIELEAKFSLLAQYYFIALWKFKYVFDLSIAKLSDGSNVKYAQLIQYRNSGSNEIYDLVNLRLFVEFLMRLEETQQ